MCKILNIELGTTFFKIWIIQYKRMNLINLIIQLQLIFNRNMQSDQHDQQIIQKSEDTLSLQSSQVKKKQPQPVDLQIDPARPRYGKLIVLINKGPLHISIGPDYLCFIGGFTFFCLLAYFLCLIVSSSFENENIIMFTYILSFSQCASYFLVAISNPSIELRQNNPIKQVTTQNQHRVCKKCGAESRRKTYHCRQCDVCINGYDHHCPWTSKCIGQGNLYRFYAFVTLTPIYILTFMGLMMGCLIISAEKANQNIRGKVEVKP